MSANLVKVGAVWHYRFQVTGARVQRSTKFKRGRKVRVSDKKKGDRNDAGDLRVYAVAAAYYRGLQKKSSAQWTKVRRNLDPDGATEPPVRPPPVWRPTTDPPVTTVASPPAVLAPATPNARSLQPWPKPKPQNATSRSRRPSGREW